MGDFERNGGRILINWSGLERHLEDRTRFIHFRQDLPFGGIRSTIDGDEDDCDDNITATITTSTMNTTTTTTTTTTTSTSTTTTSTSTMTTSTTTMTTCATATTKLYLLPYFAFGIQDFTHYLFLPCKTYDPSGSRNQKAESFHEIFLSDLNGSIHLYLIFRNDWA